MNTSDVLNKAADLIEERGWKTGSGWPINHPANPGPNYLIERTDRLCLEGGIMAALGISVTPKESNGHYSLSQHAFESLVACPAYIAVTDYLGIEGGWVDPLWKWNDRIANSADRVIEVLRAAAVIEAARETEAAAVSA